MLGQPPGWTTAMAHGEVREVALNKTDKGPTVSASKLIGNSVRLTEKGRVGGGGGITEVL